MVPQRWEVWNNDKWHEYYFVGGKHCKITIVVAHPDILRNKNTA